MPQLDPSSFSSQIFWLTICFVVLYVLLARMLLPRVQSVLTQRADTIGSDIEQAKRMKADAEMAREQYEKALVQARSRSQAMLTDAQADIALRANARQATLDAEIEKKIAQSQQSIEAATKEVTGKLTAVAAELTTVISQAVAQHTPNAGAVEALVGSLMKKQGA